MTMEVDENVVSSTANYVYVLSDDQAWIPVRVISMSENGEVQVASYGNEVNNVQSDDGSKDSPEIEASHTVIRLSQYPNRTLPLQNVDENGSLREVEDCSKLPFLHEAAILYNIKARHARAQPYTRCGDIVLAVNPYQWLNDLYSDARRRAYGRALVWEAASFEGDPRSQVEPHVYEISALSYRGLAVEGQNQSILVSGESGAGKTETVKILLSHLASVQARSHHPDENGARTSLIVKRVVDSNPLLEAFGNAKTIRNDNSSRFGKFLQLQFDAEDPTIASYKGKAIADCVLAGSKCDVYLLEKSRVVGHEDRERTYHIFYQLLAAPNEFKAQVWDGLVNTDNESFAYVGWSDTKEIEGMTDQKRFRQTCDALELIGVKDESLLTLMRAICIVMQLGNLVFEEDTNDEERSEIVTKKELTGLSELMGVHEVELSACLTTRTIKAGGEEYKVPLNAVKSKDSCDAFAKEIYARVFLWLVRTINNATCAEMNYEGNEGRDFGLIGLLDIFGFESFVTNRFEQLCINYANEKLQQKFTNDVFRSVKQEYEFEGIELAEITFADNQKVLTLIEGTTGLISILNEECVRPKGNDSAFVSKAKSSNKQSDCLISKKNFHEYEFGIQHYAGSVLYNANGFVTKNTDGIAPDLVQCAKNSINDILRREIDSDDSPSPSMKSQKAPSTRRLFRRKSSIVAETVWTKFRYQLVSLMQNLSQTRTRYIRCIKPNTVTKPLLMQNVSTVEQLRCAGVVAAVTISRSAFPNRVEHDDVLRRFRSLWTKGNERISAESPESANPGDEVRRDVDRLLTPVLRERETTKQGTIVKAFVIGKTRTYFRTGALEHMEAARLSGLGDSATTMQSAVRGHLARRLAGRRVNACAVLQCWIRCTQSKMELSRLRMKKSATLIQALFRMTVARGAFTRSTRAKEENERQTRERERVLEAQARKKREMDTAAVAAASAAVATAAAQTGSEGVEVQARESEFGTLGNDDALEEAPEEKMPDPLKDHTPDIDLEDTNESSDDDSRREPSVETENEKPPSQDSGWFRRHRRLVIIVVLLVIAAIVGAVMGVILGGGKSSAYQPPNGSDELFDFIVANSLNEGSEFDDADSYQSKAFDWLARDVGIESSSPERVLQRYALGCVYHATYAVRIRGGGGGGNREWKNSTNWLSGLDECTWFGIVCDDEGQVTRITLRNNQLTGSFPAETVYLAKGLNLLDLGVNSLWNIGEAGNAFLGSLTELRTLRIDLTLFDNDGIPTYIGLLTNLEVFDCAFAFFDGRLDSDMWTDMKALRSLEISGNNFQTSVPSQLSTLPNLQFFYAVSVGLTGDLSFMQDFTVLDEIWLDENPELVGEIPPTLHEIPTLSSVSFIDCGFSGTLPSELGLVSNMVNLWVYGNPSLTGPVPTEIGNLQLLETFTLDDTNIGGTMPEEVCDLFETGVLEELVADCRRKNRKIECSCCTKCS